MAGYTGRRLLQGVAVLFGVCLVAFLIFSLLPAGDPAVARAGRGAPPELVAHVRHDLGLDRSLPEQFWLFLKRLVLHLDLGDSYGHDEHVTDLIANRLPATLAVAAGAALLWLLISIPAGILAALRPRGAFDHLLSIVGLLTVSIPVYAIGLAGLYLFSDDIGAVPLFAGAGSYIPFGDDPGGWVSSLILPWIALAIPFCGFYARLMRNALAETLPEDYVRTARAKGLRERWVVLRHAVRLALTPIVASLGLDIGLLLGGAVLIEIVFDIPGIGQLSLDAVQQSDLPTIQGTVLVAAAFVLVANLIADLVQAWLDPRVRLEGGLR
jgi:peptide/nickel transport system permease protein